MGVGVVGVIVAAVSININVRRTIASVSASASTLVLLLHVVEGWRGEGVKREASPLQPRRSPFPRHGRYAAAVAHERTRQRPSKPPPLQQRPTTSFLPCSPKLLLLRRYSSSRRRRRRPRLRCEGRGGPAVGVLQREGVHGGGGQGVPLVVPHFRSLLLLLVLVLALGVRHGEGCGPQLAQGVSRAAADLSRHGKARAQRCHHGRERRHP